MNCAEFQRILPDIIDEGHTPEQEAHLRSCYICSNLISDLTAISREAQLLQASEEPNPRVWNSIEIALRREGLIRQPLRDSEVPPPSRRWNLAWLVPVAAALLVAFGIITYQRGVSRQTARQSLVTLVSESSLAPPSVDDQVLLEALGTHSPTMRVAYETNLRNVNAYIHDAEDQANADPNDEEARQSLMNAYQEKAMVYEMALNRSLP
jgi:hypothetical protein